MLLEGELLGEIKGGKKQKGTGRSLVYTRARLAPALITVNRRIARRNLAALGDELECVDWEGRSTLDRETQYGS
jgi:hypothetical protein